MTISSAEVKRVLYIRYDYERVARGRDGFEHMWPGVMP